MNHEHMPSHLCHLNSVLHFSPGEAREEKAMQQFLLTVSSSYWTPFYLRWDQYIFALLVVIPLVPRSSATDQNLHVQVRRSRITRTCRRLHQRNAINRPMPHRACLSRSSSSPLLPSNSSCRMSSQRPGPGATNPNGCTREPGNTLSFLDPVDLLADPAVVAIEPH